MDGEIIIGTKLDSSGLKKGLQEEKRNLEKYSKEAEELAKVKQQYEVDLEIYEEERKQAKKVREEYDKLKQKLDEVKAKREAVFSLPESQALAETKKPEFQQLNAEYFDLLKQEKQLRQDSWKIIGITNQEYENTKKALEDIDKQLSENLSKQDISKRNILTINDTLNKTKNINEIKSGINSIGKSISGITKKVVRWGLAVFGIRSAYMAVRSAMSTISQYDSQLKADIDYMKNAIAFALEPVVRKIVELMKTLMFYVAYIIKAWTGRDIFANANKSLKQANGEAKKLSKTLAGFDEMNVLNDNSSSGGVDATPSFNLTAPEDIQPPAWLKWIADNGDLIAMIIGGITGALVALQLKVNGFLGLGIGIAIIGLIQLIKDVIDYIKDPSWENFGKVLESLSVVLLGVAIAMMAVDAANPITGIILLIALITALTALIIKNWGKIKETLSKAWQWIKDKFNELPGWAKTLLKGIGNAVVNVINHIIDKLNAFLLPLRAVIATIGKVTGKNWTLGSVAIPRVPYLAKGGIVNYPGKGVPVGSAITGESGREGVIPLTDSQQMALLGEAIGKYININATIPVYVANRQIAKEIRRINAEDDFAFNR